MQTRQIQASKKLPPPAAALLIFFVAATFCAGGYYVWCSGLASLFLIAWIGWIWYKRKKLVLHKDLLALSAAVIPAAYLLSVFWAVDKGQALFGFLKTLPIPLFLVALWQISPREKQTLINAIPFIGISMFLLSGAAALLPGVGKNFLVNNRLAGFLQYPNVFAAYLLCGFLIVLQGESKNGKKLLFCLILAAGMLVSGSRTAVFLLAAALLLYLLLKKSLGFLQPP